LAMGQASALSGSIPKGKVAASGIFRLIDSDSEVDSSSTDGKKLTDVKGEIEFRDVKFHYPTRPDVTVFEHFNLKVNAGKVLAIVGPSGAGKSSVVSLLERFYVTDAGNISLDGTDVKDLNIKFLRTQLGLVSQEPVLFSGTIEDNIAYGKEGATHEEIVAAAKAANAHNFVSEFPDQYKTQVGERGAQLSGGQKQRIAIARAIVKNPKVLLLDEATSALDAESEKVVQQALDSVMKGRTTIVIAHRLSTVKNADAIAVISGGKIAEMGTHEELLKKEGVYASLIAQQT